MNKNKFVFIFMAIFLINIPLKSMFSDNFWGNMRENVSDPPITYNDVKDVNYMLLPDLLALNLKNFSIKFKNFVWSHISFYDFNSKQPGRSLYFFFAGLLSDLNDSNEFRVFIDSKVHDNGFLYSNFKIHKLNISSEAYEPFLNIELQGVSDEYILNLGEDKFRSIAYDFLTANPEESDPPVVRILYNKYNLETYYFNYTTESDLISHAYIKSYNMPLNFYIYSNFDNFRINKLLALNNSNIKYILRPYYFQSSNKIYPDSEKDLHLFIYGMINNVSGLKYLNSNVERGAGRLDIMVKYKNRYDKLIKYVIELKKTSTKSGISDNDRIKAAFDQIFQKGYSVATPTVNRRTDLLYTGAINLNLRTGFFTIDENLQNSDLRLPIGFGFNRN